MNPTHVATPSAAVERGYRSKHARNGCALLAAGTHASRHQRYPIQLLAPACGRSVQKRVRGRACERGCARAEGAPMRASAPARALPPCTCTWQLQQGTSSELGSCAAAGQARACTHTRPPGPTVWLCLLACLLACSLARLTHAHARVRTHATAAHSQARKAQ
jgi:hypothetical protein